MDDIMDLIKIKRKHYEPLRPQLTAMIDIFTLITIFLMSTTVFDNNAVSLPEGIQLPKSHEQSSIAAAPQVTLTSQGVSASFLTRIYGFRSFDKTQTNTAEIQYFRAEVKKFAAVMFSGARDNDHVLNIVCDRGIPYKYIFDVVQEFKQAGFSSVNFVSLSQGGGNG